MSSTQAYDFNLLFELRGREEKKEYKQSRIKFIQPTNKRIKATTANSTHTNEKRKIEWNDLRSDLHSRSTTKRRQQQKRKKKYKMQWMKEATEETKNNIKERI